MGGLTFSGQLGNEVFCHAFSAALSLVMDESELRLSVRADNHQNMLVRRYISDKQISVDLAADVFAYIRQRGLGRARSKVVLSDMQALDGLPRSLLMNIQLEVGLPVLETHAFLKHLSVLGNNEIPKLCEKALKEARRTSKKGLPAGEIYGEDLFHAGAAGEKMYFIQSGRLNYASILPNGKGLKRDRSGPWWMTNWWGTAGKLQDGWGSKSQMSPPLAISGEHTPDIIEEVSKGARCSRSVAHQFQLSRNQNIGIFEYAGVA
eukprot:Skav202739  [mRNA]  locus=scaffold1326:339205:342253:- [translate_table: standard]